MLRWALAFHRSLVGPYWLHGYRLAARESAKILFYLFLILFLVTLVDYCLRERSNLGRISFALGTSRCVPPQGGVMKPLGVILVVPGVLALIYQGFTYQPKRKSWTWSHSGAKEEHHTVPLLQILGRCVNRWRVILVSDRKS